MSGSRTKRLGIAILLSSFLCTAAAWGGEDPWEARREEQKKSYDALMENVPLLSETHTRGVLRLAVEDKMLLLRTPLFSTSGDGYARVKIDGLNSFALVRVQGGADTTDGEVVSPINYQFTLNDYSQPSRITTLSVTSEQTYLTISKSVQLPNGYRNVQLIERIGAPGYGQSNAVQLLVSQSGEEGQSSVSISVEANDFFELARTNPKEVEAWLRPLLRDLGQEEALAPDPLVAWQVFADKWMPDELATRRVQAVLPRLDSDDFRIREAASRELLNLGRAGAAVMVHLDRATLTAEQNARVDRALCAYAQIPPKEAVRLRKDPRFLLDCLYCDELPLRSAAYDQLSSLLKHKVAVDINDNSQTRAVAVLVVRRDLLESPAQSRSALSDISR
jgi:hypothetical protein